MPKASVLMILPAVIAAPSRERALPKVMSVGEVDRLLACVREQAACRRE
jgi:site-specific recombinase XerC